MRFFSVLLGFLIAIVVCLGFGGQAEAFCGFYVAQADADLYNQASQVAIAREGDRTILTMANDYQGEVKDFALVIPVPVILEEEQVHVADPNIITRLDNFSAPRLVEYHDPNPCQAFRRRDLEADFASPVNESARAPSRQQNSLGVTVEAEFTVGEYDIVILSAEESDGLETWLIQNNYKIPKGASRLLKPYIRQDLKFFVAKVNLEEFENSEFQSLRPLQIAYESPKFMLPIRLGTVNSQGEQDLLVYLLSPKGQVELTNYRTVQVPSDVEIPEFVEDDFSDFYKDMFSNSYQQGGKKVAFLEYAWDMASCDPCSTQPLNRQELQEAGVFWLEGRGNNRVFITRLHLRYGGDNFPEDLRFQETANTRFFQGRYIIRHPFRGNLDCEQATPYLRNLRKRQKEEVKTLAKLTGWNYKDMKKKVPLKEVSER